MNRYNKLNKSEEIKSKSEIRILDGKPYFVILKRGEVMEEECLRCHSTPDRAPGDLVRYYGPERSFNRKVGDVVSAISIRIPLSVAYSEANRFSIKLSGILLALLTALFFTQRFVNSRMVFRPLNAIREIAQDISSNPDRLGNEIPLASGR